MAAVSNRVESLERRSPDSSAGSGMTPPPLAVPLPPQPPRLKLDVPRFDGQQAHGWIFKISQFFTYHNTPEEERITVASFYLDGPALAWYQWMYRNGQIVSWPQVLQALELRFAPTAYDDPRGKLFKLHQTTTVASYLSDFESLANRIVGLSPPDLLSCFISGLRSEIRREVLAQQPTSLTQAAALARLQEEKIQDLLRLAKPRTTAPWSNPSSSSPRSNPAPTTASLLPTPANHPRYRQLSPTEMNERREKGLCFNCDERFSRTHRCKARFLLFIADEDEELAGLDPGETDPPPAADPLPDVSGLVEEFHSAQLSYHALSGVQSAQTIRVPGRVGAHSVRVLVDGGSTLNFIQAQIAHKLGLPHIPSTPIKVIVGNGEELSSTQVCRGVQLEMQGHVFAVDLYALNLCGPDIVLGTPWLKTLGPVMMDYNSLTMKFTHADTQVELCGEIDPPPADISYNQLKKLIEVEPMAQLFSLSPVTCPDPLKENLVHPNPLITSLLRRFSSLFNEPTHLPPPRFTDHQIPVPPNASPVNVRPYRYPHAQKLEIETQVRKLLDNGWIKPSNSPYSSPILLLKKKDGTWRMCVDFRALNALTIKDRFPLPTVDELLDELGSARVFSKLDLTSGFHQIRLQPKDSHKTAFRTHEGHYEYRVMPFGLCNAPATFQATMNDVFRPLLRRTVIVFFDDILVYSDTEASHIEHLACVFELLAKHQFYLKPQKCSFAQQQIGYLGHVVSAGTVAPDPEKINAIMDWPVPHSVKTLRGFLGLAGYYRKFVRNYASLASPLTSLLKKDAFQWSDSALDSFNALKQALTTAPVLALPNFSNTFIVQTDASNHAMGAVLLQQGHPLAYFSKMFCPRLAKASTYIRELHAITAAVKRWRQYLLGNFFIIQTDHRSLKELLTQVIQTPEQQHYLSKLLGYNYEIQYRPGNTNLAADALSRASVIVTNELYLLTVPNLLFMEELRKELSTDSVYLELCRKIQADPSLFPKFKLTNGWLSYNGRIWISPNSRFKTLLLQEYHDSLSAGHAGISKTMKRLSENFYWEHMKQDVQNHIRHCTICQQTKYSTARPSGLLQPLPIPNHIWEDLSMDFITGLPLSKGHSVIFVVVDRFSKGIHLGALSSGFTAYKVAELFVSIVCKHHGIPRSIVSDRDPIFISKFWRDLFKFSGTFLRMSSSYHPQTDGQTEVMNRTIEQYLRAFVHDKPYNWVTLLPWVEYHYNTSTHSGSELSPFQVMFGKSPPSIPSYIAGSSSIEACDSVLQSRDEILTLLRKNLNKAQVRMKANADKHRKEVNFDIGAWVYVKLQPYRQISLSRTKYHKLAKRYYGPYLISAKIGTVAYQLELPPHAKIHNVFHVSLLKLYEGPAPQQVDQLPAFSVDNHPIVSPLAILNFRTQMVDGVPTRFALVQWDGLLPDDTSWEPWNELKHTYDLEDKVDLDGGSIVMDSTSTLGQETAHKDKIEERPKRTTKLPKRLEDCDLT
ncbi:Ty3/gypsy retrotransposon protein [Trifolium pratense]|uniref:Ty3/gypsy retrotransposon protein n=1 Tax=Trifolium pratense TaxID=57577 RepID=A0A2K3PR87_TRIPR|nr:Ty3/gypsy retrotransposon protein [Trifolium pratense]